MHSDVGPMHGLFDHRPVFVVAWAGSPLSAKRTHRLRGLVATRDCRTTASCSGAKLVPAFASTDGKIKGLENNRNLESERKTG